MNDDRFAQLLESYGARPEHWPREERAAAQALLDQSSHARDLFARARALDVLLDNSARVPEPGAVERVRTGVLSRVKPGFIDSVLAWLTDRPWHGAVTACLPLALGIVIGINTVEEPLYVLEQEEEMTLLAVSGSAALISEITDEE